MALVGGSTTFCPGDRSNGVLIGLLWHISKIINWFNYYLPSVQISDHTIVLELVSCKCWVIWHGHEGGWNLCKNWRYVYTLNFGGKLIRSPPYECTFFWKPTSNALQLLVGLVLSSVTLVATAGYVLLKHIRNPIPSLAPLLEDPGQWSYGLSLQFNGL